MNKSFANRIEDGIQKYISEHSFHPNALILGKQEVKDFYLQMRIVMGDELDHINKNNFSYLGLHVIYSTDQNRLAIGYIEDFEVVPKIKHVNIV